MLDEQVDVGVLERRIDVLGLKARIRIVGEKAHADAGGRAQVRDDLQRLSDFRELLDGSSERESRYQEEFLQRNVVEAYAKRLFPLMDIASRAKRVDEHRKLAGVFYKLVVSCLNSFGIKPISVEAGVAFDPAHMQKIEEAVTRVKKSHQCVSAVLCEGFISKTGRVLLDAERLSLVDQQFIYRFPTDPPNTVRTLVRPELVTTRSDLSIILGTAGMKLHLGKQVLLSMSGLFPIADDRGLQYDFSAAFSVDFTF